LFNNTNRHKKFKSNLFTLELGKNNIYKKNNLVSLPLFIDETFLPNSLLTTKNYDVFNNELTLDTIEEVFLNLKYYNYLYFYNYKILLSNSYNFNLPISYTQVLDSFTSSYEESCWNLDESISNSLSIENNLYTNYLDSVRVSNPLKLRSTAKNSIITYSAIQKVFKSRFDEGRSNARLIDFSNSYNSYLFLTEPKANYEGMIGKNTESFFNVNTFVKSFNKDFNELNSVLSSLNAMYLDVPFLLSNKSDSARYL